MKTNLSPMLRAVLTINFVRSTYPKKKTERYCLQITIKKKNRRQNVQEKLIGAVSTQKVSGWSLKLKLVEFVDIIYSIKKGNMSKNLGKFPRGM